MARVAKKPEDRKEEIKEAKIESKKILKFGAEEVKPKFQGGKEKDAV